MKSFILGVSGGSGSGKTTLARRIEETLGPDRCAVLAQDSYYIDQSARFDGDGGSVNFDHPDAIEFSLLAKHLSILRSGRAIEVPIYDFASHTRKKETIRIEPRPVILVDGILILSQAVVREQLDASVFVDCPENVRFARRLHRDVNERGRTPDGVKKQFEKQVKPMHDLFVEPSQKFATLVVSGEADIAEELKLSLRLLQPVAL